MRIDVQIDMDVPGTVSRFGARFQKAQKYLDSEVLRCSAPYVPMKTGALMRSGINATKLGSGSVVYNTPYARRLYYGTGFHFSRNKHPQACAQWFEKAKAVHMDAWMNGVDRIIKME